MHTRTCIAKPLSGQFWLRSNSSTRKHQLSSLVQIICPRWKKESRRRSCLSRLKVKTVVLSLNALALFAQPSTIAFITRMSANVLLSFSFCCVEMQRLDGVDGSVWTFADFPGKRPEMDVGFGLCPDKCYCKLVKVEFVTRNTSRAL